MTDEPKLSNDQKDRINATLKRIRMGLERLQTLPFEEPAHLFKPEAVNEKN